MYIETNLPGNGDLGQLSTGQTRGAFSYLDAFGRVIYAIGEMDTLPFVHRGLEEEEVEIMSDHSLSFLFLGYIEGDQLVHSVIDGPVELLRLV